MYQCIVCASQRDMSCTRSSKNNFNRVLSAPNYSVKTELFLHLLQLQQLPVATIALALRQLRTICSFRHTKKLGTLLGSLFFHQSTSFEFVIGMHRPSAEIDDLDLHIYSAAKYKKYDYV